MKTILALGAGRLNLPAARAMSSVARVIAVDRQPFECIDEPGFKTVALDFADHEALLNLAKLESVDGVYPFSDHAIRPAAMLSAALGLGGLKGEVAENFLDKARMRNIWSGMGLSQPEFVIVQELSLALQAAKKIGYPIIVKPASSGGGGRGVFRVDSESELEMYYPQAVQHNRYSNQVLIEKFIVGVESSLELLFIEGQPTLIAISTKAKPESKSQVATEIVYPGELSDRLVDLISKLCTDAARALGIVSGVTHFEVISTPDEVPFLIEVGGRVGGGHTFHPIASHVSGVNYPELVAHLYLGQFKQAHAMLSKGVLTRGAIYSFPVTDLVGEILDIGFSEVAAGSHSEVWKQSGELIAGMNSSMDRLGCVVSLADNREEALCLNRKVMDGFFMKIASRF